MKDIVVVKCSQYLVYREQVVKQLKKEYEDNLSESDENFILTAFGLCVSVEDTAEIMNLYNKDSKDGY